jgi:gluconolactonase
MITRRNMLAAAGATAASALLSRGAGAQSFPFSPNQRYPDPAVQILDPSFTKYRIYSSTVEQVATGMRWAEGPAYFPEGGYLLFSDIPNNRIMKFDEKTGQTTVFRSPSNYANGNARDRQGRLVTCEHSVTRRITRTEKDGKVTVLADKFEGKRLNAPNDLVVKSDDSIWFTDPLFGINGEWEGKKGKARTGHHQRLSPRQGRQAHRRHHRYRQSQRPRVLAGRKETLRRRSKGHAQPQHLGL